MADAGTLSGITVVEQGIGIAAAMCGKAMADLGADVVIVEPPEGSQARSAGPFAGAPDPEASGQFLYLNANKRGAVLDLEVQRGRETLKRLASGADIFVTDANPHRSASLGTDYESLATLNPGLVATYVTPFGSSGSYRDYKGTDLVAWHMGGLGYETPAFAVTDLDKEPPLHGGGSPAEYLAGWTAATASMIALCYRETYGTGQMVEVSMMECVANHIRGNFATHSYDISKVPESRVKAFFPWIWPCKDGHISTSFIMDHWWEALKDVMGRPKWAENPDYGDLQGRRDNVDVIEPLLTDWLMGYTRRELYRMLSSSGISTFPVLSMKDILSEPQYVDRGFFVEQDHPKAGLVKQPGPPVRFWSTPWKFRRPAPTLGQHTSEVLKALRGGVSAPGRYGPSVEEGQRSAVGERNRPLKGLRVLDFGWILSVPHTGAWLGTMGAQVIRVESRARLELSRRGYQASADGIAGVNRSANWNGLNYSKLGVTLNLGTPKAIELIKELVAISDVVMENFATGVMDRLGLGYDALRRIRPDLVMLSGSTLGVTGPDREASGFGPNVASFAGVPAISGYAGGPPANLGGNWPDYGVGTIMVFSILAALRHRSLTGEGQYIEVSMAEVMSSMIPEAFLEYTMNGRQLQGMGNHHPRWSPHNVYRCLGDDQWAAVAVTDDAEWRAFCGVVGHPEWVEDARFASARQRKRNEDEFDGRITEWTRRHAPREVMKLMQEAGVAAGPVMGVMELMQDPHLAERGFVVEMNHAEVGKRRVAGLPARFSAMRELAYSPAPLLGQHNGLVFGEVLGVRPHTLEKLVEQKAIY